MLRLLHTADVHLGARHADLGDAAVAQRERQFAAFRATVDLALSERVDLFLVAGDLFDSNVQPRRSVERVAAELARLVAARVRVVMIPGTHDVYDRSSVYRAYDLPAMAGSAAGDGLVTLLTPERPWVHIDTLDAVIHGPVFATKRAPHSPLRNLAAIATPAATWRIGLLHASVAIPGRTEHDEVVITTDEIAASGLDYLALGHWHSAQVAKAGSVTYAYAGAPEPVAVDQDRAGKALLVGLEQRGGAKTVTVEERTVGRTSFEHLDIDASAVESQPALVARLRAAADPDLVLDVRLIGVRPDALDLEPAEVEEQLKGSFLRLRVRDASRPPFTGGVLPPPETIVGAFIRNVEGKIADLEASGETAGEREAEELRDVLRLGRLLLAGHEVTL
jgi:DNA repair protein SbcD/Mre11